jgi:hypothetical protein
MASRVVPWHWRLFAGFHIEAWVLSEVISYEFYGGQSEFDIGFLSAYYGSPLSVTFL